jgi:3',5'-cyclic AMP phosphodiesterase CpdA
VYRIFQISDVHFGPPHLRPVSEAVQNLIDSRNPDLVVISGDLTQRAKSQQFKQAREFVDRISVPVLAVPGNHDVPMYRCWERVFSPYGAYRKYFEKDLEPTFEDSNVFVVGVNTAFGWTIDNGRFTNRRLDQVEQLFRQAPNGCCRIVVAHHHLVRPPELANKNLVINAQRAMEVFSEAGVELILSGHLHRSMVESSADFYPAIQPPVVIALSGTTTSSRGRGLEEGKNSCNWVELTEDCMAISTLRWSSRGQCFESDPEPRFSRNPSG